MLPILAGLGALACMSNPRRRKRRRVKIRSRRRNPSDEQRELQIYIVNDSDLYRQRVEPIIKNLAKKMKKGTYDHAKAVKLWMYLADAGAQKYTKEFDTRGASSYGIFTKADRLAVAKELADYYRENVEQFFQDIDMDAARRALNPRRKRRRR